MNTIDRPEFTRADVEILQTDVMHKGYAEVQQLKLRHKLHAGGWSEPFHRELIIRPNAVAVIPYDPKLDRVVLIEQFRVGALQDKKSPWLLELVAGIIDKDVSTETIAQLEIKEEANLEILKLMPVCEYWSTPGEVAELVTMYCAIVDASKAGGNHGLEEENEDIKVHVLSSSEAFAAVRSGRINNAATIIALQWLELALPTLHSLAAD